MKLPHYHIEKTPGMPIKVKAVFKVREYMKKGLTESEVARVMKTTRQQVNRWVSYLKEGKIRFDE